MLKDEKIDSDIIVEIEKDIERLNKITKRFSEIGSVPKLYKENVNEILNNFIKYLNKRNSSLIKLKFNSCNEVIYFRINKTLFEWVIENLIKNAIDSMNGKGTIEINVIKTNSNVQVEIRDSGKGILKENLKKIFNPGFSLKKKGWGLGLSLSKRIINLYHGGKIYVKESKINSGSILVIRLPLFIESS
jgi:signal transduction histidine kinase